MKKGLTGFITLGVIIVIGFLLVVSCTAKVPAGYGAVQYSINGGVKEQTLKQGWHLVRPGIHTTNYTIGLEQSYLTKGKKGDSKDNERFSASSSEGKSIDIDLTFSYKYDKKHLAEIFTQFKGQSGVEVRDVFIKPNIVAWTKEVVANYKVADIIGVKRAEINDTLTEYLAKKFEPYHIQIKTVSLINVNVDADTQKAINKKIKAQQDAETQKINNQTNIDKAKAEAEAKVTQAQAEADAKKIAAEAEAKATLLKAEAEAKANKELSKSLDKDVLQNRYIEKWDGKLPKVTSEGSGMLYNIDSK